MRTLLQNGSEASAFKLQNTYRTLKAVASLPFCMALAAGCLLIASGNAIGQNSREQIQQSQEDNPANWKRFVSMEGRFAILFPGSPTVSTETVDAQPLKFVLHKHQLHTIAEYGVMYADYPKSVTDSTPADVLLDQGAKGAVAAVNSQLLSIGSISVGGYPGRFLKERMPNGTIMEAKLILVGQRMYQIAITTPREDGADLETVRFYGAIATKFLDSFELIGSASAEASEKFGANQPECPPDLSNCVSITSDYANVRAISMPKPAYPPIARAAHASGSVEVKIVVDEQGNVISAQSISGHPLLQAAAVAAARKAKFSPLNVGNQAMKFAGVLQYHFVID